MFQNKPSQYDEALQRQLDAQAAAFPPIGTTLPPPVHPPAGSGFTAPASQPYAAPALARKERNWKRLFKRTFIVLAVLALLTGAYVGAKFLMNAGKALDGSLFGLLQTERLKGENDGRVNILLAGNSADDPGHAGAELTDSIMVVSLDTRHNRAFMLSIPRDLWVESPDGRQYMKINAVYAQGKQQGFSEPGYAEGGMGALQKVVARNLDIPLHYYALVNYSAFRDAVNAVGGIDVVIDSDDPRGLYDAMIAKADGGPLRLKNGPQHLDGQTALNLARARGSGYSYGFPRSDFNRSEHQRMMLVALKQKAVSAGVLANPIKVGELFDSIGNNVETDFKTSEIRRLYKVSQKIPDSSIVSIGLNNVDGKNLLRSYNARGQSSLVPAAGIDDYSQIQAYLQKLMEPPAPKQPDAAPER